MELTLGVAFILYARLMFLVGSTWVAQNRNLESAKREIIETEGIYLHNERTIFWRFTVLNGRIRPGKRDSDDDILALYPIDHQFLALCPEYKKLPVATRRTAA